MVMGRMGRNPVGMGPVGGSMGSAASVNNANLGGSLTVSGTANAGGPAILLGLLTVGLVVLYLTTRGIQGSV